jgi:hypothetical protein
VIYKRLKIAIILELLFGEIAMKYKIIHYLMVLPLLMVQLLIRRVEDERCRKL